MNTMRHDAQCVISRAYNIIIYMLSHASLSLKGSVDDGEYSTYIHHVNSCTHTEC